MRINNAVSKRVFHYISNINKLNQDIEDLWEDDDLFDGFYDIDR